ncbi:SDR family NAD(P)-dependent oxidoreductase, partial [Tahibacter harae]
PLAVSSPRAVQTAVWVEGDGGLAFHIYTETGDGEIQVHCQGRATRVGADAAGGTMDVAAIGAACPRPIGHAAVYARYAAQGMVYGPAYRGLASIQAGDGQALGRLEQEARVNAAGYWLYPGQLDAALQTAQGVTDGAADRPVLPFALESVTVWGRSPEQGWAWVRVRPGSGALAVLDVDLCDDAGRVQVQLSGFTARVLAEPVMAAAPGTAVSAAEAEVTLQQPQWVAAEAGATAVQGADGAATMQRSGPVDATAVHGSDSAGVDSSASTAARRQVLIVGATAAQAAAVSAELGATACAAVALDGAATEAFEALALAVFAAAQAAVRAREAVRLQVVLAGTAAPALALGVAGLLRTVQEEHAQVRGQVIEVASREPAEVAAALQDAAARDAVELRWADGAVQQRVLRDLPTTPALPAATPWKTGGVYLITGGAGGLGRLLAQEIAQQAEGVTLVLAGRSMLDAAAQAALSAAIPAATVRYHAVDVGDAAAVQALVTAVIAEHGALHGVIHAAGVVKDSFVLKKTAAEWRQVLRPKVAGVEALDAATAPVDLDLFVVFSSLSALGNAGQADYAAANGYLDGFAQQRQQRVARGERQGRTVSVNWPYWADGGMRIDAATQTLLKDRHGSLALSTAQGWAALYQALASGAAQVLVRAAVKGWQGAAVPSAHDSANAVNAANAVNGTYGAYAPDAANRAAVKSAVAASAAATSAAASAPVSSEATRTASITDWTLGRLYDEVAALLKVSRSDLDADAEFSEYGFDSISLTALANRLNSEFGLSLMPTVFFEQPSLRSLAQHLARIDDGRWAQRWVAAPDTAAAAGTAVAESGPAATPGVPQAAFENSQILSTKLAAPRRRGRWLPGDAPVSASATGASIAAAPAAAQREPVAIVGMSGRFPQADDLAAFWQNLISGRDSIEEIPVSRWDWRVIHGDSQTEANRSHSKWGGFIAGADEFDPLFFGISPREAMLMDPQQRLLLQHAWAAIEDAGHAPRSLSGSDTGVFIGTGSSGYCEIAGRSSGVIESYSSTGSVPSVGPNRLSYFLNLHGPSEPIETACSSALVAVHRAVRAIHAGDCSMALAGGVNTLPTPVGHISFSKAGMLSEDGRCKTFSAQANGYVRGEGVGVLLLKRLSAAQADGDRIYAVIRGSAENHGGRANSLTAPNPKAQADLLRQAYRESGIDVRTVGYIEAHGTGTPLGDPIEINALKSAFQSLYLDSGSAVVESAHCGLGSVKTNIGHLEMAAGAAGLIKVLLQLQHGQLAPSLHCAEINPYIELDGTPFRLVREAQPWPVLHDAQGQALPRRAGVSSFGFGGVNAHVVLEEYPAPPHNPPAAGPQSGIFVLSARSVEQLQRQAEQLLQALAGGAFGENDLADIAYTLQVGRDAMEHRLALIAGSLAELRAKLARVVAGDDAVEGLYRDEARRNKELISLYSGDEDIQSAMLGWLRGGRQTRALELWVKGQNIDWAALYTAQRPRRISLPTYPFARERFWFTPQAALGVAAPSASVGVLHSLLQRNTSTLSRQRFSSWFSGQEGFLRDDGQGGREIAALLQLEIVRLALREALQDEDALAEQPLHLTGLAWLRPLNLTGGRHVHVELLSAGDAIDVVIAGDAGDDEEAPLYWQGRARLQALGLRPLLDLPRLRSQSSAAQTQTPDGMLQLALGRDGSGMAFALAQLRLNCDDSTLPLALLPALRSMALALYPEFASAPQVRAMDSLEIFAPCPQSCIAVLRLRSHEQGVCLDFELASDDGEVCIQGRGVVLGGPPVRAAVGAVSLLLARQPDPLPRDSAADSAGGCLLWCGFAADDQRMAALQEMLPAVAVVRLGGGGDDRVARYADCAAQLQRWCATQLRSGAARSVVQLAVPADDNEDLAGLSALLQTATRDLPDLSCQLIAVAPALGAVELAGVLRAARASANGSVIRALPGAAQVERWQEVATALPALRPWKENGVYLITLGSGDAGALFAREIAAQTSAVQLILLGAADGDPLLRPASGTAAVEYHALDLGDVAAVEAAVAAAIARHGRLDGVIHTLASRDIAAEQGGSPLRRGLAAALAGLVALDAASAAQALDFFVVVSALPAFAQAGTDADAAANGFAERFVAWRVQECAEGRRHGRSVALAWPFLAGADADAEGIAAAKLGAACGLKPLDAAAATASFYRALASGSDLLVAVRGHAAQLRQQLGGGAEPVPAAPIVVDADQLRERVAHQLKLLLARTAELAPERIAADEPLESYGIDSLLIMRLNAEFTPIFGEVSKTLLYEFHSLQALAEYFSSQHVAACLRWCGLEAIAPAANLAAPAAAAAAPRSLPARPARRGTLQAAGRREPIAIIGLSGRYPQAPDLDAFWDNLAHGRDSVVEIPAERWSVDAYFAADREVAVASGKYYAKWGGFLDGVAEFDPLFFGISPREAFSMDPQERLFLQCAWSTLEDAGYTRERLATRHGRRVGVFAGITKTGFEMYGAQEWMPGEMALPQTSFGSMANRVSYLLNLSGPSMPVDTMCSASLTAVHEACEHIYRGECELALAGGVNIYLHPSNFVALSAMRMLSNAGRCKSFGEGGDGFVPGEGVGAVLLKPLAAALRDGDNIHALIRSTSINHGGKTNGYTVPNPVAQAELIRAALDKAGLSARQVSYIEAHGTGTVLGDPIEIAGLSQAFAVDTDERQFCAIGSVKSNIGHLEAAAGIAGLTKLVLQLKNGQLAPSLHAEVLNPNIDFSRTPFVLQRELGEWPRPRVHGREQPRIAGVSSFGAGGSNAHVLVEEYTPPARLPAPSGAVLIVLSARSEDRLHMRVQQLLHTLQNPPALADLAYTLQVGREAMDERLALVAGSAAEAAEKLGVYLAGRGQDVPALFRGQVRRNRDALGVFEADEDLRSAISGWLQKGKLAKLAELWVRGLAVDWEAMHANAAVMPRRISLPTYPFARDRYWFARTALPARAATAAALHALLQRNVSTLSGQRFASHFDGSEAFFAEDPLGGRQLPALLQLEIARLAVREALQDEAGSAAQPLRLRDVAWQQPAAAGAEGLDLQVELHAVDAGRIEVVIAAAAAESEADSVFCSGVAELLAGGVRPHVDLVGLRQQARPAEAAQLAGVPGASQLMLGEGTDGLPFALAQIDLPSGDGLVPAELLAPLRALAQLLVPGAAAQPAQLSVLDIHAPCAEHSVLVVRAWSSGGRLELDFDVTGSDGLVFLRGEGLVLDGSQAEAEAATMLLAPELVALKRSGAAAGAANWLLWCDFGTDDRRAPALQAALPETALTRLESRASTRAARYADYAAQVLRWLQGRLGEGVPEQSLLQLAIPAANEQDLAGLAGLLRSATREQPRLRTQLVIVAPALTVAELGEVLSNSRAAPDGAVIHAQHGSVQVEAWRELAPPQPAAPWKDGGVYLITGGAGGLGLLFAREIAAGTRRSVLVLTGRSQLDAARRAELAAACAGATVDYRAVDVTDAAALEACVQDVLAQHGRIDGVIHSAGTLQDSFLLRKDPAQFNSVLAPKVAGLVELDQATAGLALDFFVAFSSLAAVYGNVGQGDYAAANGFMDRFSAWRQREVAQGRRYGVSLSLNWPLWAEGGMRVDPAVAAAMRDGFGLEPLPDAAGLAAFYAALASGSAQVLVLQGQPLRLRQRLLGTAPTPAAKPVRPRAAAAAAPAAVQSAAVDGGQLTERVVHELKLLLARTAGLAPDQVAADEPLESYGIDSLLIMRLNSEFTPIFGEVSKTLLYEFQSLQALAAHFVAEHGAACLRWCGLDAAVQAAPAAPAAAGMPVARREALRPPRRAAAGQREPIAVIGLSGRYPQAPDLAAFWNNLSSGRDSITEIPAERWAVDAHFLPDREQAAAAGKYYAKWGGFIDGVTEFDPLFFGISPREAFDMDPQERLFIESCWATLEDAGYTRERLATRHGRRVGVFAGITKTGFELYGPPLWAQGEDAHPHTSFSSVANRISYLFNLSGPSMPVDTMCSASLTAIHEACEHIYRGECELALAGGVNLYLHPANYVALCVPRMLSSDGRCKSFGDGGDGFVPGEGVGTLLLKPLAAARADGDVIHALIRSTSINHGGKTNGYTVPSPQAQAELVRAALDKAGLNARQIGYIEAHGTGTVLGDPIEIAGLSQAFAADTDERQFCAIGSVKSNIGHLEAAAGIAGVTKLILQFRHAQLAPSLHARRLNPNIDFSRTPFVVQQTLSAWPRPVRDGREQPRLAGISSFGAGGSNAHVILEEYVAPTRPLPPPAPVLIVLSARDEERLQGRVQQLRETLKTAPVMADLAYTLQVGREAMEERLALIATTAAEAADKLGAYLAGRGAEVPALYRGQVRRNKDSLGAFEADDDLRIAVASWLSKGKLGKLAEFWVKGLALDWDALAGSAAPQRISLPTYPFARERYWIDLADAGQPRTTARSPGAPRLLHPLLHENTSDLSEQRFSSSFAGDEFFFADHVINGRRVLPGVAYLEMARAAVERSLGEARPGSVCLSQVVWVRPLAAASGGNRVHIALQPLDSQQIRFEVRSQPAGGERIVHCQGMALVGEAAGPIRIDLAGVKADCDTALLSGEDCYARYAGMGMQYGPSLRGIEQIHIGQGQVWADLALPPEAAEDGFMLHPSLMDSALQSAIGLSSGESRPGQALLPFALESVEIYGSCVSVCGAWIRFSADGVAGDKLRKFDVDLCDIDGDVMVRLTGLAVRVASDSVAGTTGMALLKPQWLAAAAAPVLPAAAQRLVLLCGFEAATAQAVQAQLGAGICGVVAAAADGELDFSATAEVVLGRLQQLLRGRPTARALLQVAIARGEGIEAGLAGMLRTAQLENPQIHGQLLLLPGQIEPARLAALLGEDAAAAESEVRYVAEQRQVRGWTPLQEADASVRPWKSGGVYLITGGAGGLGLIFAREIAQYAEDVHLVLAGRSELNEAQEVALAELRGLGAGVAYRQLDVSDAAAVRALVQEIAQEWGMLNGVIHAAGVLRDNFLVRKTMDEVRTVFAAKVGGLVALDEATADLALDFFIVFSSLTGALGNVGQGDYAAANGFMDGYVSQRNARVRRGERQGRSLSINWPFWAEGGMSVDAQTQARLLEHFGLAPLAREAGLRAFYAAVASGEEQVLVLSGAVDPLLQALTRPRLAPPAASIPAAAPAPVRIERGEAGGVAAERVSLYLKKLLSGVLKLPAQRIDAEAPLEAYGIDSIMVTDLTNQLERHFGPLSKTLLFEHQTIQALAAYFREAHPQRLQELLAVPEPVRPVAVTAAAAAATALPAPAAPRRFAAAAAP